MNPEVFETPPKTFAESPYAANDGFAAVTAATPYYYRVRLRE
jgi:hypothetical protein